MKLIQNHIKSAFKKCQTKEQAFKVRNELMRIIDKEYTESNAPLTRQIIKTWERGERW